MKQEALVSIITPCYNGERYVERFLQSVLSQTYQKIELIFVNDGSTDSTEEIVLRFADIFREKGIRFIYLYQENAGQASAMNKGLAVFSGEYLTWVDSDDILYPDNIRKKVEFLEKNEEYGFVLSEAEVVCEDNLDVCRGILRRVKPSGTDYLFHDYICEYNVVYGPGTVMVRKEVIEKAIPNKKIYECREGQNWQMMLPISYISRCGYLQEILVKIVSHGDSHSLKHRTMKEKIQREERFIEICSTTIKNIPDITEREKKQYCRLVRKVHREEQFRIFCGGNVITAFWKKHIVG